MPCVVGTGRATELLNKHQDITVSCAEGASGFIYEGILPVETEDIKLDELPWTRTRILVNAANPEHAFSLSALPVEGVGSGARRVYYRQRGKNSPARANAFRFPER